MIMSEELVVGGCVGGTDVWEGAVVVEAIVVDVGGTDEGGCV